jgi:hypothetical protein
MPTAFTAITAQNTTEYSCSMGFLGNSTRVVRIEFQGCGMSSEYYQKAMVALASIPISEQETPVGEGRPTGASNLQDLKLL